MKAVIGQFYKTIEKATKRADELKRMWKGRVAFGVVGGSKGYVVLSETQLRYCGLDISPKARRYGRYPSKINGKYKRTKT